MIETRTTTTVLATLLLLTVLTPLVGVYSESISGSRCVETYFLAVTSSGKIRGLAMPARICIEPSDSFSLEIEGVKYRESVYTSFLVATYALEEICGLNLDNYRIVVDIEGHDVEVKGASASLTFAIGVLSLLGVTNISEPWSGTGVLSIDGFVDAIGGLRAKLRAALEKNISVIYIPLVNSFELSSLSPLSSRIREVTSVLELCNCVAIPRLNEELARIDKEVLERLYRVLKMDMKSFEKYIRNIIEQANPEARRRIDFYIANLTKEADEAIKHGHIYTAASLMFTALLRTLTIYYNTSTRTELAKLIDKAKHILDEVETNLSSYRSISLSALPFLIVVLDRINEAKYYAELFNRVQDGDAVFAAVMAYGRAETARSWVKLLIAANNSGYAPLVPMRRALNAVERVLRWVAESIEWNLSYAPLSLSTIASTRSYIYTLLSREFRQRIVDTIQKLLAIHLEHLDPIQLIVPYFYAIYARDLGMDSSAVSLGSLASLISAATRLSEKLLTTNSSASLQEQFVDRYANLITHVTPLLSITTALCLLATLYIVEKRLGLPGNATLRNSSSAFAS